MLSGKISALQRAMSSEEFRLLAEESKEKYDEMDAVITQLQQDKGALHYALIKAYNLLESLRSEVVHHEELRAVVDFSARAVKRDCNRLIIQDHDEVEAEGGSYLERTFDSAMLARIA